MDHPQEVEDEDPIEEEVEVADVEDTPKMIKMKKEINLLTSKKLSVITVRRWVTLLTSVMQTR